VLLSVTAAAGAPPSETTRSPVKSAIVAASEMNSPIAPR
jgi:hypothetical protein